MAGYKEAVLIYIYVHLVAARDNCYTSGFLQHYCEDGYYCCRSNTQCCRHSSTLTGGTIAGIVIGCIAFAACIFGLVLCFKKSQQRQGQVVSYPQGQVAVASIQSYPHGPMYGAQPPAYGQSGTAPPVYPGGAGPSTGLNQQYPPPVPFQSQGNAVYPPT